ncbi:MAG: RCC1 domain-containing protein, partial [Roseiflexaceae bacterium]
NTLGQLGNGTTTNSSTPVAVSMPAPTFTHMSAGAFHTCAYATDSSIYCWGANNNGQLGNNTTTPSMIPVAINMPAGVSATHVSVGYSHTCLATMTQGVWCWGYNALGQLGDASIINRKVPNLVVMP